MPGLPAVTGTKLVRALRKSGFEVIRGRGSLRFPGQPDGRRPLVAPHRGETIGRGLRARILRHCELTREEPEEVL